MIKRFFPLLLVVSLVACKTAPLTTRPAEPAVADSAMAVCAHPQASKVGIEAILKGGNAIDAAVAIQFALAVVYPAAGNLGGGGFMVIRMANGDVSSLDFREKAPAGAATNMFIDETNNIVPGLSVSTHLASGIPGSVAGLWEAHQRYGKLPWKELVQPAIDFAENGFILTSKEADGLNSIQDELRSNNSILPEVFLRDHWNEGDSVKLPDLALTLERIRDHGPGGFYEGETARLIVEEMERGHGLITLDDLKDYKAIWRTPLTGTYKDYKIISMGPPSSGGVALVQLLKSVEPYPFAEWGHNSARTTHLFTEAERRAYADRAAYLGDPDFSKIPVDALTNSQYVRTRMESFTPEKATPSNAIAEGDIHPYESEQTTHTSVVDANGNAVSLTTTLNDSYGSKIIVAGAGFLLNNEMDDFSSKPGVPNMYGAIGGDVNKILPNKRMLSSMTPTIVEKDGRLFMVVGTPGGTTIITSVFQTIVNVIDFKMNMQQAVDARRIHSQWFPDEINAETSALSDEDAAELRKYGHHISERSEIGRVDAILIRPDNKLEGGADSRGDDTALGF
jgi:gamma-glutamyltranspeptidase / glutathione hydrolase